jgi:hypothetical protein
MPETKQGFARSLRAQRQGNKPEEVPVGTLRSAPPCEFLARAVSAVPLATSKAAARRSPPSISRPRCSAMAARPSAASSDRAWRNLQPMVGRRRASRGGGSDTPASAGRYEPALPPPLKSPMTL